MGLRTAERANVFPTPIVTEDLLALHCDLHTKLEGLLVSPWARSRGAPGQEHRDRSLRGLSRRGKRIALRANDGVPSLLPGERQRPECHFGLEALGPCLA